MTRRKKSPRAIPPHHATGAERSAATAADRYVLDIDGPRAADGTIEVATAHYVIRDQSSGEVIERCKTSTLSEVEDRVALLNRGTPSRADNQSWGKLTKERARLGRGVKSGDPAQLSTTEWVERLVAHQPTVTLLREYVSQGRALGRVQLARLLTLVAEPDRVLPDDAGVDAVSQQLYRKFGIRRADDHR